MMPNRVARAAVLSRRIRGYILVTGLLFLVIATLLGLALFRGTGIMDHVAANSRDKERSFEAAQAALQYAEDWLAQGKATSASASACKDIEPASNVHVCSNALPADFATAGFNAGFQYTPANLTVQSGGGLTTGGSDINYEKAPGFYIENLGFAQDGKSVIYQVTSWGFGGNSSTQSVLRSTYLYSPTTSSGPGQTAGNLDGP